MTRRARSERRRAPVLALVAASLFVLLCCDDAVLGDRAVDPTCRDGACVDSGGDPDAAVEDARAEDARDCPVVEPPACDAGSPVPRSEGGCVTAYVCAARCAEDPNGTCTTQEACAPGGRWSRSTASAPFDCGDDLGCCRTCAPIAAPPADFCDGGPITDVREGDCVVGFECR